MKILHSILTIALLLISLIALWFAKDLNQQRKDIIAHQQTLASALSDLAEHAGVELPPLQLGFNQDPLRKLLVTYKNLQGELQFKQQEVARLNKDIEEAQTRQKKLSQQLRSSSHDLGEQGQAVATLSQQLRKGKDDFNKALLEVKELKEEIHFLKSAALNTAKATPLPSQDVVNKRKIQTSPMSAQSEIRILSVNLDWEFVVLDAGENKGLRAGQHLFFEGLDGHSITAIISRVESNVSVADVELNRIGQALKNTLVHIQ